MACLPLIVADATWLLPHRRYEINDDKDCTMSDLVGDIPMRPPTEAVTTADEVESTAEAIAIENMLEQVNPTEREWKVHLGTGVPYHTKGCEACVSFVKHIVEDKERGSASLTAAIQRLENHWLDKLENHPFTKIGKQGAYDHGFDDGYVKAEKEAERRQKKGKERAKSPEIELEKLEKKIVQLEHEKAELNGENERLQRRVDDLLREAAELRAGTLLLKRESPLPYAEMTEPYGPYRSIAADPILLQTEFYRQKAVGYETVTPTSATSSSTGSAKRKAQELVPEDPPSGGRQAKQPKPRIEIRQVSSRTILPFDKAGNQYLPDGAWMRMMKEVPGEGVHQKLDYLATRRWLPIWADILKEIRHLEATGGTLGNAQKKVKVVNRAPYSVMELAMTNRGSTPAGLRWVDGIPNTEDLMIWQVYRAITKVKDDVRHRALRQAFDAAVTDDSLWEHYTPTPAQSQGLLEIPFPAGAEVTPSNMAGHLKACGVTREFLEHSLRPYVLRNQAAAAERRNMPPGTLINTTTAPGMQMLTQPPTTTTSLVPIYADLPMDDVEGVQNP